MSLRRKPGLTLVLALAGALLAAAPAAAHAESRAGVSGDHAATLAALKELNANGGPGAGVLAGGPAGSWHLSSGTATLHTADSLAPDEHFRVGSQSKTFLAVAVLKLAERGGLALDDPIERHLPGVVTGNGHDGTRITVRHLLQHTSGIPRDGVLTPQAGADGTYTLASLVKEALREPSVAAPGTTWAYSNGNYEILGMLVEKLTGAPLHRAVTDLVITPLGLGDTVFPAPGDRVVPAPLIHGHAGVRVGGFFWWTDVTRSHEPSLFHGSGAIISTTRDLTTFYRALFDGRALRAASLAEMTRTVPLTPGGTPADPGYGLGLLKLPLPCGGAAWGHDGGVPGYYSETLVTEDGRYASGITNAQLNGAPATAMYKTLTTALCEDRP
jgi:D-alanyl-D-alanine carboxypeptidase